MTNEAGTTNRRGRFITFEGGEGAGKSTQIARAASFLKDRQIDAVVTREPGGSPGAEQIRRLLVEGEPGRWDAVTEMLLHFAARRDHVRTVIAPALAEGKWVLCDRFVDSTLAYQGYGHGLGEAPVRQLADLTIDGAWPDLTIVLDLPVEQGLKRAGERSGSEHRYERMGLDFHRRLRDGFLAIAAADSDRCRVINAMRPVDEIADEVVTLLQQHLINY